MKEHYLVFELFWTVLPVYCSGTRAFYLDVQLSNTSTLSYIYIFIYQEQIKSRFLNKIVMYIVCIIIVCVYRETS